MNVEGARRVEAAEAAMVVGFARGAMAGGRDAFIAPVGAGVVVYGGEGAPFNKLIGVGLSPLDEEALARAEAMHDARGAAVRAEVSTLAEPVVLEALSRRGYALVGFENVLGAALDADADADADEGEATGPVLVRTAREDEHAVWQDAVIDGFAAPDGSAPAADLPRRDALEAMFKDFFGLGALLRFVAFVDGALAGGASLFCEGEVALMTGAATRVAFRRRGVQRALLRARLAHVARVGGRLAVVTTQPGSQSQANAQRAGFALLYARAVMVRPARPGALGERGPGGGWDGVP